MIVVIVNYIMHESMCDIINRIDCSINISQQIQHNLIRGHVQ